MALERLKPAPLHDLQFPQDWNYTPVRTAITYEVYLIHSSPSTTQETLVGLQTLTLGSGPHAGHLLSSIYAVPSLRDRKSG